MSTTLTIRNLDEAVKQKLRLRAAKHQTSMEGEAREILRRAVEVPENTPPPRNAEELKQHLNKVRGLWKKYGTSDKLMTLTRGED